MNVTPLEILIVLDEWRLVLEQFLVLTNKCITSSGTEIINSAYALYCR